jgi:D-alanine-D-alanine ligase
MNIAIITGGESGEREVSISSAKNIADIITFAETKTYIFPEDTSKFIAEKDNYSMVIPVIHGAGGEDGALQNFLEEQRVPYLFSSPEVHALCIDKRLTKAHAGELGLKVPQEIPRSELTFPLFAKPNYGGSSIASKFCSQEADLQELLGNNQALDFILEEPIIGREFTVGVISRNGAAEVLPIIEIIPKTKFFDYESKYNQESLAEEICPAKIGGQLAQTLHDSALKMHTELGVKCMSRSDFLVDSADNVYFLEINTIPGLTKTSLIPKMVKEAGLDLNSLFQEWSEAVI